MTATRAEITAGDIRGNAGDGVHEFLGVPYAQPPVGDLRWHPPIPVDPWEGERDCTRYGAVHRQPPLPGAFEPLSSDQGRVGDDSLNLNVWTPDPTASGLPVLVWIHGGAFYAGSGTEDVYRGAAFARDGVVTVTINYRLGVDGYLYLDDHFPDLAAGGSLGMEDQLAALAWVQENISAFGGDPARVTVAGESAGAMSTGALLACPSRRGLFQQAILQSGAAHNTIGTQTASMITGHVLDHLGIAPGDTAAILGVDPAALHDAQAVVLEELVTTRSVERFGEAAAAPMPFVPVHGTPLLPERPLDAIAGGAASDVRVLCGCNAEEALILMFGAEDLITEELVVAGLDARMAAAGRSGADALAVYRDRLGADARPHVVSAAVETDWLFRIPQYRFADAQSAHNPDIWMYEFTWRSSLGDGGYGAGHFVEVPFAFHTLSSKECQEICGPTAPAALADIVHGAWVAFVATGSPETAHTPDWKRWTAGERDLMLLDLEPRAVTDPRPAETALWTDVR